MVDDVALSRARVTETGREPRLNLGCGLNAPQHWHNYDRSPMILLRRRPRIRGVLRRVNALQPEHMRTWPANVVRRDLSKPLPHPDGSVAVVYSSHMLEHLYLDDARRLLAECARVLRSGGLLRLALPDGEQWARDLLAAGPDEGGHAGRRYQEMLRAHPSAKPRGRGWIAFLGGSNWHKWQPTRGLVRALLAEAGFADVTEHSYRAGRCPDLAAVEVRPDSMFFEALRCGR